MIDIACPAGGFSPAGDLQGPFPPLTLPNSSLHAGGFSPAGLVSVKSQGPLFHNKESPLTLPNGGHRR